MTLYRRCVCNISIVYFQFPELVDKLGLLYQMMEHRVDMFGRLTKLQSKLDIILSQVSPQSAFYEEYQVQCIYFLS